MDGRYARQTALPHFGDAGQKNLAAASVVVFGCGGVGAGALPILAGAGVGRIVLVDNDTVSLSNLHRQTLFCESEVGEFKAEIAKRKLNRLNGGVSIETVPLLVDTIEGAVKMLEGAGIALDATDNFKTRNIISEACRKTGTPLIMASAGGYQSQTMMFGANIFLRDVVGAELLNEGSKGLPIFGAAAHLSGVWGAGFALKFCAKIDEFKAGYFQSYDFESGKFFSGNL